MVRCQILFFASVVFYEENDFCCVFESFTVCASDGVIKRSRSLVEGRRRTRLEVRWHSRGRRHTLARSSERHTLFLGGCFSTSIQHHSDTSTHGWYRFARSIAVVVTHLETRAGTVEWKENHGLLHARPGSVCGDCVHDGDGHHDLDVDGNTSWVGHPTARSRHTSFDLRSLELSSICVVGIQTTFFPPLQPVSPTRVLSR